MKKRVIAVILFLASTASTLPAQPPGDIDLWFLPHRPSNIVSMQLFTDGSLMSLNYERLFPVSDNMFLAGRVGVGYGTEFRITLFGSNSSTGDFISVPHQITANLGSRRSFIEFGVGGSLVNGYTVYPLIGYRFHPWMSNNLSFRVNATWPLMRPGDILFIPLGGSIGFAF